MLDARALTLDHGTGPDFDPLLHWWHHGVHDGLNPHPLFDAAWYCAEHGLPPGADPLAHWLEIGRAAGFPVAPHQASGAAALPAAAVGVSVRLMPRRRQIRSGTRQTAPTSGRSGSDPVRPPHGPGAVPRPTRRGGDGRSLL